MNKGSRRRPRRPPRSRTILRRRLTAIAILLVGVVAVAAAVGGLSGGSSGEEVREKRGPSASVEAVAAAEAAEREALADTLRQGVRAASRLGGEVEAAVMLEDWRRPLVLAGEKGGADHWMRMWSMSKVVVAVALLRSEGWGERPGKQLSAEVEEALRAAFVRSENCPQRRVVLELQRSVDDTKTPEEIEETLRAAGGQARVRGEEAEPDSACVEFLEGQTEIDDPLAPALLLGTSEWRVGDAARFMHALGDGTYGRALSRRVLTLMREPKERSREALPAEFTAVVDWGAGRALAGLDPAYKAGWGGAQQGEFMAGQMALVELPSGGRAAVAVMFHPDVQPSIDDPGLTSAPQALEAVMRSLARELRADQQPGSPR